MTSPPSRSVGTLAITGDDDADRLLNTDPLALLVGMLLDQQVPMEWAFRGPATLLDRLGRLDTASIAEKTKIFVAILAKRMGVAPDGWRAAAGPFADDVPRSVADIDGPEALEGVRAWKKAQKAAGRTKQQ